MNYLQKIEAQKQEYLEIGEKHGFQKACDFIAMALNDPDVLGKRILSGDVIDKVISAACTKHDAYFKAFRPSDPEADYYQEKIDVQQKKICKDKLQPFQVRYPWIRKIKY